MYTDNDGQDTLPDESTREVIDYCRSIQGKDLEVFKLINPGDEAPVKTHLRAHAVTTSIGWKP